MTKADIINEINNVVLSGGNRTTAAHMRQLLFDILDYIGTSSNSYYFSATNTGNNYAGTNANLVSLNEGDEVVIKINVPNTGASTFKPNTLPAGNLLKFGNMALEKNDLKANQIIEARFDGINYQIISVTDNIGEGN